MGIILRVLRLEVSVLISYTLGKGVWFFFLLSPLQCTVTHYRNCKRLHEFEKYKSQGKAVEVTVNSKEKNSSDFCLDFVKEFDLWRGGWRGAHSAWGVVSVHNTVVSL
jgi:hypothetical protein